MRIPLLYLMATITLPVSLGEALDKLTIIDIKLQKISDPVRKSHCFTEFSVLEEQLRRYVEQFSYYYKLLREINLEIWELQDKFHGKDVDPAAAAAICKKILEENDRRFRVKAKLNHAAASTLREQKGYAEKKAFVYTHLGLGDMFWMNGAIRYLATAFDEVVVVCKDHNAKNVAAMYADDPSIKLLCIPDDYVLQPFQVRRSFFEGEGFIVFSCGYHTANPQIYDFPHSFYDDMSLPRDIRTRYFHVAPSAEGADLLQKVQAVSSSYVVVHQQASTKRLPIWGKVAEEMGTAQVPILDINENHYSEDHPFYTIAQAVVGKPLLAYKDLLENAAEIHLLESSLYCFASHLDLSKVRRKICYDAYDNSNERLGIFTTGKV
jgi:hypothetical protein